jgi:hypothetical protein
MMVAATEGNMSIANLVMYFSMPATPRSVLMRKL